MPGRTVAQVEIALDQLISIVMSQEGETIEGVTFESAVADGDIVYLDDAVNIWKRTLAQDPARSTFFGVAIIDTIDKVQIAGRITNEDFRIWDEVGEIYLNAFTSGVPLYASKTKAGIMTHDDTGLLCGVATGSHTFVMNIAFQFANAIQDLQESAGRDSFRSISIPDDILITDDIIHVDATVGQINIQSLTASQMVTNGKSKRITVKRINLTGSFVRINGVTGAPDGYIDLVLPLASVTLTSDGTIVHFIG